MITLERPAYYDNNRYAEYDGLSTDDKAAIEAYNADKFYEIDTGKTYRYNEASNKWIEQPKPDVATKAYVDTKTSDMATKAYVDAILPAFTAEDEGKVLGIVDGALAWVAKA